MPDTHSVSWARESTIPRLAELALVADETIGYLGTLEPDQHQQAKLEAARNTRRIALDELVRRGAIESYSFV